MEDHSKGGDQSDFVIDLETDSDDDPVEERMEQEPGKNGRPFGLGAMMMGMGIVYFGAGMDHQKRFEDIKSHKSNQHKDERVRGEFGGFGQEMKEGDGENCAGGK